MRKERLNTMTNGFIELIQHQPEPTYSEPCERPLLFILMLLLIALLGKHKQALKSHITVTIKRINPVCVSELDEKHTVRVKWFVF